MTITTIKRRKIIDAPFTQPQEPLAGEDAWVVVYIDDYADVTCAGLFTETDARLIAEDFNQSGPTDTTAIPVKLRKSQ